VRVLLIAGLVLLLQLPSCMIGQVARERQQSRDQATAELARTWGGRQDLLGPFLVVPYRYEVKDDKGRVTLEHNWITLLPERLDARAAPQVETRRRGLFEMPVYRTHVKLTGRFAAPQLGTAPFIEGAALQWGGAHLVLRLSDVHALDRVAPLAWGKSTIDFASGGGALASSGIHAKLAALDPATPQDFAIEIDLRGSQALYFAPVGGHTHAEVQSAWPHPAFQGAWLPAQREVGPQGFTASWDITKLARGLPSAWKGGWGPDEEALHATLFGVDLIYPVDPYRMSERSLKYSALLIGLSFLVLWLFELLTRRPVHLAQYLLFGAALCVFYLLELSLAEHFGFAVAYAVAAGAVTLQVALYARSALGGWRGAGLVFAAVTGLYALLYLLLREEDYSLLVGSGALFAVLSLVMFLTRGVRWTGSDEAPARQ
jgi:inner membrane protein